MAKKPWLRVTRVAKMLDCRPRLVYEMVQDGKLEAIRLGPRGIRISEESVEQFVSTSRIQPEDF